MNYQDDRSNDPRKIISEHRIIEESVEVISKKKNHKIIYPIIVGVFSLLIISFALRMHFIRSYKNLHENSNQYTRHLTGYGKNLNRLFAYFDGYDSIFEISDDLDVAYKDIYTDNLKSIEEQYEVGRDIAVNDYYRRLFVIISGSMSENKNREPSGALENEINIDNENVIEDINIQQDDYYIRDKEEVFNSTSEVVTYEESTNLELLYSKVKIEGIMLNFNDYIISHVESDDAITPENYTKTLGGHNMYSFFKEFGYDGLKDYFEFVENDAYVLESINNINLKKDNVLMELERFLQQGIISTEQNYYNMIMEESNSNHKTVKNYVESNPYFKYYIYDEKKDIAYGNIEGTHKIYDINDNTVLNEYLKKDVAYYITLTDNVFYSGFSNAEYSSVHESGIRKGYTRTENLKDGFSENSLTGYVITPKKNLINSVIHTNIHENENKSVENNIYKDIFIQKNLSLFSKIPFAVLIIFIGLIYLTRSYIKNSFIYYYGKLSIIPFKIKFTILFASIIIAIYNYMEIGYNSYYSLANVFLSFVFIFISSFVFPITIFNFLNKEERMKIKFFRKIKEDIIVIRSLPSKSVKLFFIFAVILLLLGTIGAGLASVFYLLCKNCLSMEFILIMFIYLICVYIWANCYKLAIGYCKLRFAIERIYLGEEIDLLKNSYIEKPLNQLENIEKGFLKSVEKMIKSEKMKAELITNVSHDLKTPLTSIINYVELLDKEGLSSNNAPDYLKVLEQKSQRLKLLIEDLFEVSKLSSGNVTLETSKINIIDLLNQTIGELQNKLDDANINLKFSYSNENVVLDLDGKKIWRVFENLINNIIKYSLAGTRAYVNLEEEGEKIVITFRNISSQELDFEADELFERFKRGDTSRSTDGNGLGLSISQNIILLHKGEFDIIIDGDLFKVIIVLSK